VLVLQAEEVVEALLVSAVLEVVAVLVLPVLVVLLEEEAVRAAWPQ
jgi:hypothetical protein